MQVSQIKKFIITQSIYPEYISCVIIIYVSLEYLFVTKLLCKVKVLIKSCNGYFQSRFSSDDYYNVDSYLSWCVDIIHLSQWLSAFWGGKFSCVNKLALRSEVSV